MFDKLKNLWKPKKEVTKSEELTSLSTDRGVYRFYSDGKVFFNNTLLDGKIVIRITSPIILGNVDKNVWNTTGGYDNPIDYVCLYDIIVRYLFLCDVPVDTINRLSVVETEDGLRQACDKIMILQDFDDTRYCVYNDDSLGLLLFTESCINDNDTTIQKMRKTIISSMFCKVTCFPYSAFEHFEDVLNGANMKERGMAFTRCDKVLVICDQSKGYTYHGIDSILTEHGMVNALVKLYLMHSMGISISKDLEIISSKNTDTNESYMRELVNRELPTKASLRYKEIGSYS